MSPPLIAKLVTGHGFPEVTLDNHDVFGDNKTMQQRYRFREYPALVFVRSGHYVGTIMRMRDFYLETIGELFAAPMLANLGALDAEDRDRAARRPE